MFQITQIYTDVGIIYFPLWYNSQKV